LPISNYRKSAPDLHNSTVPGIYVFIVFLVDSDPEGLARDGEFLLGNAGLEAERVRAWPCAAVAALQTAVSDTKVVVLKATENDAWILAGVSEKLFGGTSRCE
jgi:hypothetical protein